MGATRKATAKRGQPRRSTKNTLTKKPGRGSVLEAAKAQLAAKRKTLCKVCSHEKAAEDLAQILQAMADGDLVGYSQKDMVDLLNRRYPTLQLGRGAVENHLKRHAAEQWRAAQGL